jgi:hypothetical protein
MARLESTVSVRVTDLVCAGLSESVAMKVRDAFAALAVGVPLIAPVVAFSVRPAGSVPLVSDQV